MAQAGVSCPVATCHNRQPTQKQNSPGNPSGQNIQPRRRHGIAPAPKRSQTTSWRDFISAHMNVLAGADFFTVDGYLLRAVLPPSGSRGVSVSRHYHPDQEWMQQIARNATQDGWGQLDRCRLRFSTIETRSYAHRFGPCWRRAG